MEGNILYPFIRVTGAKGVSHLEAEVDDEYYTRRHERASHFTEHLESVLLSEDMAQELS